MVKVFVYGTLRPGRCATVEVPGFMHDLGSYPGVSLGEDGCNSHFIAEPVEVSESKLDRLDFYEGYSPTNESGSLYLRVPYLDGWIYVFNSPMDQYPVVDGGDWLKHTGQRRGSAASMVDYVKEEA